MTDPPASPRLAALRAALAAGDGAALGRFWAEVEAQGTPLIEPLPDAAGAAGDGRDVLVTFPWRATGEAAPVVVFSTCLRGPPAKHRLHRLAGTDLWYRTYRLPAAGRATYRLSPGDSLEPLEQTRDAAWRRRRMATWRLDPLNRAPFPPTGTPWQSSFSLPDAPPQPWAAARPGVPAGAVQRALLRSEFLGNERAVWTYTPPGPAPADACDLLLLFDGGLFRSVIPTPTILDNLIAAGALPPLVAVLVDSLDHDTRNRELTGDPSFLEFLTAELLPWVRERHHVTRDARRTVVGGASYGGLTAALVALRHPETFGGVLALSGSFYWKPAEDEAYCWVARRVASGPRLTLRLSLDVGRLEDAPRPDGCPSLLEGNRRLRDALAARGYPFRYAEYAGGHDPLCWRGALADGLRALLGAPASEAPSPSPAE